jgi:hypothetical protein
VEACRFEIHGAGVDYAWTYRVLWSSSGEASFGVELGGRLAIKAQSAVLG